MHASGSTRGLSEHKNKFVSWLRTRCKCQALVWTQRAKKRPDGDNKVLQKRKMKKSETIYVFFLNKMLFSWPKNSLYVKGCVRLTLTDRSPAPSKGSLVFFCLLSAQSSIAAVEKTPTKAVLHVYLCSVQPVLTQQQQPGQWPCTSMFEKYSWRLPSSVVV